MLALLSAPRGRVSAARLLAKRDEVEEAYGIVIRPARTEPAHDPRVHFGVPAQGGGR
jgi:hypothetical protein